MIMWRAQAAVWNIILSTLSLSVCLCVHCLQQIKQPREKNSSLKDTNDYFLSVRLKSICKLFYKSIEWRLNDCWLNIRSQFLMWKSRIRSTASVLACVGLDVLNKMTIKLTLAWLLITAVTNNCCFFHGDILCHKYPAKAAWEQTLPPLMKMMDCRGCWCQCVLSVQQPLLRLFSLFETSTTQTAELFVFILFLAPNLYCSEQLIFVLNSSHKRLIFKLAFSRFH